MNRTNFSLTVSVSLSVRISVAVWFSTEVSFLSDSLDSQSYSIHWQWRISVCFLCLQTFEFVDLNLIGEFFSLFSVSCLKNSFSIQSGDRAAFHFTGLFDARSELAGNLLGCFFYFWSLTSSWHCKRVYFKSNNNSYTSRCPNWNETKMKPKRKERSNISTTITFLVAYLSQSQGWSLSLPSLSTLACKADVLKKCSWVITSCFCAFQMASHS